MTHLNEPLLWWGFTNFWPKIIPMYLFTICQNKKFPYFAKYLEQLDVKLANIFGDFSEYFAKIGPLKKIWPMRSICTAHPQYLTEYHPPPKKKGYHLHIIHAYTHNRPKRLKGINNVLWVMSHAGNSSFYTWPVLKKE